MIAVLLLGLASCEQTTMLAVLAILSIAKLIAILQKSKLDLVYDQANPLFKDFVSKTKISTMIYEPFMLALSPAF